MQKSLKEKDQGFTLIELLVVIVIIGILAAIAIPIFLNQQKKAVDSSMKSDVKSAATMIETWRTDNPTTAITAQSVAPATSGTLELAGFKTSKGNTVAIKPGTDVGSYCISAINAASSTPASYILYKSDAGGLQDGFSTTGC
ncbi:type IV pilin protein [Nocardioides sp. HB32]